MAGYRDQAGVASPEQLHEFLGHFVAGRISHVTMEAFNRQFREDAKPLTDETYPGVFSAAIARCGCDYNSGQLRPDVFGPDVFGTLGEGYLLGEPTVSPAAKKRGYWLAAEIEEWLAGPEVAGKGLEAAYLVDGCEFGHNNPNVQLETPILIWHPSKGGRVAFLYRYDGVRFFNVYGQGDDWLFRCRVLLRKVQP